jgi:hypothetical protein
MGVGIIIQDMSITSSSYIIALTEKSTGLVTGGASKFKPILFTSVASWVPYFKIAQ